ncbi:MAG: RDD family protein [Bacteroidota bacterium]
MILVEASRTKRFLNVVFEIAIMSLLIELALWINTLVEINFWVEAWIVFVVYGGYYILLEYFFGKTVGKFLTKTRVVNSHGNPIRFRIAVLRYLARWLPFEFLSLALGADAKAWHDSLTHTHEVDNTFSRSNANSQSDILDDDYVTR